MFQHSPRLYLRGAAACAALVLAGHAAAAPDCRTQRTGDTTIEMCLFPGQAFQHDLYVLKADNVPVFALVDDFAENVTLQHTIPPGLSMELALSRKAGSAGTSVTIKGGCVPESKDGAEVARLCNFHWGEEHIVKDVRFTF